MKFRQTAKQAQSSLSIIVLFGFLLSATLACAVDAEKNGNKVTLDTSSVTLSGLSSGAYMATQFHLSHPDLVSGVGLIAGGPYGCARNSIMTALGECVNKAPAQYPESITNIKSKMSDTINQLINDKVWILHGTLDTKIIAKVSDALHAQYQQLIQAQNLRYINDKPFAHLFPTTNTGVACDEASSPFIGKCGFDAAGEMLSFIATTGQNETLKPALSKEESQQQGKLIKFKQSALAELNNSGMNEEAFVYIPNACAKGETCKVHISFHGCNQSIDNIGQEYAANVGLNEWAASNNLIVLYPQTAKSSLMPMNPQACWDWWGYTDENYLNKQGKQISAVHQMVFSLQDYLNQ